MNLRLIKLKNLFICIGLLGACSNDGAYENTLLTPCDCSKTFEELVDKLEKNYVGLALLKDTERAKEYELAKTTPVL